MLELKRLSVDDGMDIYNLLQNIPAKENGFLNTANGLNIDEYREWYLQEQIPYNVVITDIGGLQGGEPVFDSSSDWIIKSLGTPDVVSKNVNGQNVREIIFKYVLFAQKSGKLKIPAVRFNGYALSNDGGGIFINNAFNFNLATVDVRLTLAYL